MVRSVKTLRMTITGFGALVTLASIGSFVGGIIVVSVFLVMPFVASITSGSIPSTGYWIGSAWAVGLMWVLISGLLERD